MSSLMERNFHALLKKGDDRIHELEDKIKQLENANKILEENGRLKRELEQYKAVNRTLMDKLEERK